MFAVRSCLRQVHFRQKSCLSTTGGISCGDRRQVIFRAYGKAPRFSSTDTTQFKRAIDMTDDELAAIASGATLHVVK